MNEPPQAPAPPPDPSPGLLKARRRKNILRLVGIVGLGFFVFLIVKIGPRQVWEAVRHLTVPQMLALVGLRLVYWSVRSANWAIVLRACGERIPFLEILGARVAGNAVGFLTPVGNLGAEMTRVFMLDGIDRKKILATVVIDKTIEFLVGTATVALSLVALVTSFALPHGQKVTLFSLTAAVFLALLYLMSKQKQGLFTWVLDRLSRIKLKIPALEKRREKIREIDAAISDFYAVSPATFFLLFGCYFVMTVVWAFELFVTFRFVGNARPSLLQCFIIVTLGAFTTFVPIPGSLGVYELTYVSVLALLRVEMAAGLAVVLVRRVLASVWSLICLIPLLRKRGSLREVFPGRTAPAEESERP